MLSFAVHRGRQPQDRRADTAGGEAESHLGSFPPSLRATADMGHGRNGTMPVAFGRHTTEHYAERPGGDDERSVGTREHLAKCLDGAAIGVGCCLETPRECQVVFEG